jgi:hypothetical protein
MQRVEYIYLFSSQKSWSIDRSSTSPMLTADISPSVEDDDADADPFVDSTDENEMQNEYLYHGARSRAFRTSTSCPLRIPGPNEGTLRFQQLLERVAGEHERVEIMNDIPGSPNPEEIVHEIFESVRDTDEEEIDSEEDRNEQDVEAAEERAEEREDTTVGKDVEEVRWKDDEASLRDGSSMYSNPFTTVAYVVKGRFGEDDLVYDAEEQALDLDKPGGHDTSSHVTDPFHFELGLMSALPGRKEPRPENDLSQDIEEKAATDDTPYPPNLNSSPFDLDFQHSLNEDDLPDYGTALSEDDELNEASAHFGNSLSRPPYSGPLIMSSDTFKSSPFKDQQRVKLTMNDDGSDSFAALVDPCKEEPKRNPPLNDDGLGSFADPSHCTTLLNNNRLNSFADGVYPPETLTPNPFANSEVIILQNQVEQDTWWDTSDWPPNPFRELFNPGSAKDLVPRSTLKISAFAGPNPFSDAVNAMNIARRKKSDDIAHAGAAWERVDDNGSEKDEHVFEDSDILSPLSLLSPVINAGTIHMSPFYDSLEEYLYQISCVSRSGSQIVRPDPYLDPRSCHVSESVWEREHETRCEPPIETESFSEMVLPTPENATESSYLPPPLVVPRPQNLKVRNLFRRNGNQQTRRFLLGQPKNPQTHRDPSPHPESEPEPEVDTNPKTILIPPTFYSCRDTYERHDSQQQPIARFRIRLSLPSPTIDTVKQTTPKLVIKVRAMGTISRLSARILPRRQRIPIPVRDDLSAQAPQVTHSTQSTQSKESQATLPRTPPTPEQSLLANLTSYRSLRSRNTGDYMRFPPEVRNPRDYVEKPRYEEPQFSGIKR